MLHRINGKLYTENNGLARYQYAEIDLFFQDGLLLIMSFMAILIQQE